VKINQRIINVDLTNNPYRIIIGNGIARDTGSELIKIGIKNNTKILLVTNSIINKYYSEELLNSLAKYKFKVSTIIIKEGEENKNLETIKKIHNAAFNAKLERGSLLIALGGGVVGDIAGFAAATWLRGINFIQIPTTLLAMVDASIGGKTGVNHPGGKNLIGAFHQPKLVLIDPNTLLTLPKREFQAGMAEVIKYSIIGDYSLFKILEDALAIDSLDNLGIDLVEEIIERSAATKAKIVISDERESGIRATLNYGHTFGHVVENLSGYGKFLHGEAVAIGMIAVGELAVLKRKWNKIDSARQKELIIKAGLPYQMPDLAIEKVLLTLEGDKKVKDGKIRFVLPKEIGNVEICDDVSKDEIIQCLNNLN
tara:strand:- start:26992 stop:28098 length:1107 start_codon:yes stop_codon:yes gene_type:complete